MVGLEIIVNFTSNYYNCNRAAYNISEREINPFSVLEGAIMCRIPITDFPSSVNVNVYLVKPSRLFWQLLPISF